jgi:hypothetical protein
MATEACEGTPQCQIQPGWLQQSNRVLATAGMNNILHRWVCVYLEMDKQRIHSGRSPKHKI